MAGWQGADNEMSPEDKKNMLNAEITELERRKSELAKEIEGHYRAYKNRLDLDYNTRLNKIEEDNSRKETEFKKREDNFVRRQAFLENQISSGAAEIKTRLDIAQERIKEASDASTDYSKLSDSLASEYQGKYSLLQEELSKTKQEREDLVKEKLIVKDIQDKLSSLEKQNQETQRRLDAALKDVESRQAFLTYWDGELKKEDEQTTLLIESLAIKKLDLDNREVEIEKTRNETKVLFDQSKQLLKDNQDKQALLDKKLLEVKDQGEKLSVWRDELNEIQLTLNEKERYYIIREREIDAKIKILQKLREVNP